MENRYHSLKKVYLDELREFKQKQADVVKTTNEIFGPIPLSLIKEQLQKSELRKMWYVLNAHYSPQKGGAHNRENIMQMIQTITYNGKSITEYDMNIS